LKQEEAVDLSFTDFARRAESRLRHALVARYGTETGRDAAAEALAYGWEHWDRVGTMNNPVGYLYRVGQSRARRSFRPATAWFPLPPDDHEPHVEPGLPSALAALSTKQRTVVVLIHCFAWSQREVADFLSVAPTTVQKHAERGIQKLRRELGVTDAD
jgi:DNA-directed RNA polymerase specialized sigma24 family protein